MIEDTGGEYPRRSILLGGGILAALGASQLQPGPASAELLPEDFAYLDLAAVVASPDRFPGIDPSGATDSSPALQAAIHAAPAGGTVIVPPGMYLLNDRLTVFDGKSVRLIGYGATLVQNSNRPVFGVVGPYEEILAVSSVTIETRNLTGGASEMSVLSMDTSALAWVAGDILKIVSEDTIPERRVGSAGRESRLGEFAVVDAIEPGKVLIAGLLRDAYVTNVRVTRLGRQAIALEGFTIDVSDARIGAENNALITLTHLLRPSLTKIRVNRSAGIVFQMISCYGYVISDVDIGYATDVPSQGKYGYGILDNSCNFGLVRGGIFRHLRHAYTDDTAQVEVGASLHAYGRTYGTRIIGAVAAMCTSASWDTHHCSEGVEFVACSAVSAISGGTRAAGFQLRGKNHRIASCSTDRIPVGVLVTTENASGESRGHIVRDVVIRNATDSAIVVSVHSSQHATPSTRDDYVAAEIQDVVAYDSRRLLTAVNSTVVLGSSAFYAPVGVPGVYYNAITNQNASVKLQGVKLDYSQNSEGIPRPIVAVASTGWTPGNQVSEIEDLEIVWSESAASRHSAPFLGPDHTVRGRGLRWSYPFTSMPGTMTADSSIQWSCYYAAGVARSDLTSAFLFLNTALLGGDLNWIARSVDSYQFIQTNPAGTAITAAAFPPGKVRGQVVTFWQSGTGSWKIRHGASYGTALLGNADVTMTLGSQVRMFWDGTVWRQMP